MDRQAPNRPACLSFHSPTCCRTEAGGALYTSLAFRILRNGSGKITVRLHGLNSHRHSQEVPRQRRKHHWWIKAVASFLQHVKDILDIVHRNQDGILTLHFYYVHKSYRPETQGCILVLIRDCWSLRTEYIAADGNLNSSALACTPNISERCWQTDLHSPMVLTGRCHGPG